MPQDEWEWFGQPGHFIAAFKCMYHLHTHVGPRKRWCVSTVGEYYPDGRDKPMHALSGRGPSEPPSYYETMVFALDGDGEIADHEGLMTWKYVGWEGNEARTFVRDGHLEVCRFWHKKEEA